MLIKMLLIPVIILLVYYLRETLLGKKGNILRMIIIVTHSLLLSGFLIFFSNSAEMISSEQIDFMKNSDLIDGVKKRSKIKGLIDSNFVSIDIVNDNVAIFQENNKNEKPEIITDRKKLITLLNLLKRDSSLIDLIVCDIGFETSTAYDCELKERILDFYVLEKIVCGRPQVQSKNDCLIFPDPIYADVRESTPDNIFLSHSIIKDGYYSLSYILYNKISGFKGKTVPLIGKVLLEHDLHDNSRVVLNTFIPANNVTDESFLPKSPDEPDMQAMNLPDINYWQLGDLSDSLNKKAFHNVLESRKKSHKKNIILLGTFTGPNDLHSTVYGPKHGITNILNTTIALKLGQHRVKVSDCAIIFLSFFLISFTALFLLLRRKDLNSTRGMLPWKVISYIDDKLKLIERQSNGSAIYLILKFIIDEIHFLIMLLLVCLLYLRTGELLNGLILILYFTILNQTTKFFIQNTTYP